MSVLTKKIQTPVKVEEVKTNSTPKTEKSVEDLVKEAVQSVSDRVKKLEEGGYDSGYGAPKDTAPQPEPPIRDGKEEEGPVPGVPGTHSEEGGYDSGYAAPKATDKGDGSEDPKDTDTEPDEDDMEEKVCESCGANYKAKKAKKAKKGEEEEEEKKMEEEDTEVLPKKAELFNFGKTNQLFRPTKEELAQAKSMKTNRAEIFGLKAKKQGTVGRQLNEFAMKELARMTPTKE